MVQVTDEQLEATADGSGAVSVVSTAAFAGATQAVAQVSKRTEQPVDTSTLTLTCRVPQTNVPVRRQKPQTSRESLQFIGG